MPYMWVVEVDGLWHQWRGGYTYCNKVIPHGSPTKKLGGGPAFGTDPDPPAGTICQDCFKAIRKEMKAVIDSDKEAYEKIAEEAQKEGLSEMGSDG